MGPELGLARCPWLKGAAIAHRGLHGPAVPENSRAAASAAIAARLGIECDVQLTADGEAVVFHDFTLERLTGEAGPVAARTAAELATLTLAGTSETIPRLDDLLALVAGQVPLLIEVKLAKGAPAAPLCVAVARALDGYQGAHAVMSFDPNVPSWFARFRPTVVRGLVAGNADSPGLLTSPAGSRAMARARADFLALDIRDLPNPQAVRRRARGLGLATWTVRTPAQLATARAHADAPIAEGLAAQILAR